VRLTVTDDSGAVVTTTVLTPRGFRNAFHTDTVAASYFYMLRDNWTGPTCTTPGCEGRPVVLWTPDPHTHPGRTPVWVHLETGMTECTNPQRRAHANPSFAHCVHCREKITYRLHPDDDPAADKPYWRDDKNDIGSETGDGHWHQHTPVRR
jgi:hypothetical protein